MDVSKSVSWYASNLLTYQEHKLNVDMYQILTQDVII